MSGFAGIFSVDGDHVSDVLRDRLACLINRNNSNKTKYYADKHLYLFKFDVQAYQEEGWHQDEYGVTCLAGSPVLPDMHGQALDRPLAAAKIQQDLLYEHTGALTEGRGTYCGVMYSNDKKQINLFVDKLGCRPVYYTFQKGKLYFSTALRVLEELDCIERALDIHGAVEKAVFSFCLADRTGYKDIYSLVAGTHLVLDSHALKQSRYWSLQEAAVPGKNNSEILKIFDCEFSQAIKLRLKTNEARVNALFSGGLDSRCVVTKLWNQGIAVDTYTFGDSSSYDCLIARQYTEKLGLSHTEKEFEPCDFGPGWPLMVANEINRKLKEGVNYFRPKLVWVGDGGSVGIGRVYLTRELVGCLDNSNYEQAANLVSSPFRNLILSKKYRKTALNYPTQYIFNLLQEENGIQPLNKMIIFLMENDQRRHLEDFFQNIDLYGIDFHLPFFDSEVVTLSMAFEPGYTLFHKMYHDWLQFFPDVITKVTWQHYPGHLSAPLPLPEDGTYQWSKTRTIDKQIVSDAMKILVSGTSLINRPYLLLCILLTQFGIRDMSWLLKHAIRMHHFAKYTNA